jgi:hypothetical protein
MYKVQKIFFQIRLKEPSRTVPRLGLFALVRRDLYFTLQISQYFSIGLACEIFAALFSNLMNSSPMAFRIE